MLFLSSHDIILLKLQMQRSVTITSDFFKGFTIFTLLDYLLEILKTILPYASGIIIFYLTRIWENRTAKKAALQKRLDSFYIPFFQFYCQKLLSTNYLISFSDADLYKLFKFLSDNICNMGTCSQATYSDFYLSFCDLLEARRGTPHYFLSTCSEKFENNFTKLCKQVFKEYGDICHKLHAPKPAEELCQRPPLSQLHT